MSVWYVWCAVWAAFANFLGVFFEFLCPALRIFCGICVTLFGCFCVLVKFLREFGRDFTVLKLKNTALLAVFCVLSIKTYT
jgi:hypothetical protein